MCLQEEVDGQRCHAPDVASSLLQQHASDSNVVEALATLCATAATASEDTKCKLMESPFPAAALETVRKGEISLIATAALCTALKALMMNDDARPPASQAFMHARILGTDRGAVPVFLQAFRRAEGEPAALHGIVSALQQLCANDEICMRVRKQYLVHAKLHSEFGVTNLAPLSLLMRLPQRQS